MSAIDLTKFDPDVKKLPIETALPADLPKLMLDSQKIEQVLVNLIVNAAHAMRDNPTDRTPVLKITSEQVGQCVQLKIIDNGHGIPPDKIKKIFDPFFTTKGVLGTGLGLSITHGIIESHGGKIEVTSEVGVGTTFTISLPIPTEAELAEQTNEPEEPELDIAALMFGGEQAAATPQ
jgi:two-component system NtrC family sensor kinase